MKSALEFLNKLKELLNHFNSYEIPIFVNGKKIDNTTIEKDKDNGYYIQIKTDEYNKQNSVSPETLKVLKDKNKKCKNECKFWNDYMIFSTPTLNEIQTWLREKHNIFITPYPIINKDKDEKGLYYLECWKYENNVWNEIIVYDYNKYSSYEEALDKGIRYVLNFI